jgi:hypothetical protein
MSDERRPPTGEEDNQVPRFDLPAEVTEPCMRFIVSNAEVMGFMQAFAGLAHSRDAILRHLSTDTSYKKAVNEDYRQFLAERGNPEGEPDEIDVEQVINALLAIGPNAEKIIAQYAQLLFQMFLTRAVDNFLLYLSELLLLLYRTRIGVIPADDGIEEFIGRLAEQYVERTSLGGTQRLVGDFKETFEVKLFDNATQGKVDRVIARRNIIVHQRGIANRYFIKKFPHLGLKVGEPVLFDWDNVSADVRLLFQVVLDIDMQMSERFSLPCIATQQKEPTSDTAKNE